MNILLSRALLLSIDEHIQSKRGKHDMLDVYKTAEIIRLKHIHENVAREDIIQGIVLRAGSNVPLEFNKSASDDRMDIIDCSDVKVSMPALNGKSVHGIAK